MANTPSRGSNDGLHQFVEEYIKSEGLTDLTVEDVLQDVYGEIKDIVMQEWQDEQKRRQVAAAAEEVRRQMELDKRKADQVNKLRNVLREKRGLIAITADELKDQLVKAAEAKVEADAKAVKAQEEFEAEKLSRMYAALDAIEDKYDEELPHGVFIEWEHATTFRGWVKKREMDAKVENKKVEANFTQVDQESGIEIPAQLDDDVRQAFTDRFQDLKDLEQKINEVIIAWGKDPFTARLPKGKYSYELFGELLGFVDNDPRFSNLNKDVLWETSEQRKARQQAESEQKAVRTATEAQAKADKAHRDARLSELQGNLKTRLMETNPELSEEVADLMVAKIAKKFGNLSDINAMFTAAFNSRLNSASQSSEMDTAKIYAKAAGITDEEVEAALVARQEQRDRDAADQAKKVADTRGTNFGEAKPKPESKKGDGNGKPNGKKRGRGQQQGQQK